MLSPRPSLWAAPSIWKLEVETPHKNSGARVTDVLLGPGKLALIVAVICLPCGMRLSGVRWQYNAGVDDPTFDQDQASAAFSHSYLDLPAWKKASHSEFQGPS